MFRLRLRYNFAVNIFDEYLPKISFPESLLLIGQLSVLLLFFSVKLNTEAERYDHAILCYFEVFCILDMCPV